MPATCFECGDTGHIAPNCPNKSWVASDNAADGRPRWCGYCDERSRHVEQADGRVRRCQCHPESHMQLKQHRKCPDCRKTVVVWDTSIDCAHHILAGADHHYVGPPVCVPQPPEPVEFVGGLPTPAEYPV
jgi:hypothetical protein